jgi:hypothetical protein
MGLWKAGEERKVTMMKPHPISDNTDVVLAVTSIA